MTSIFSKGGGGGADGNFRRMENRKKEGKIHYMIFFTSISYFWNTKRGVGFPKYHKFPNYRVWGI